VKILDLFSGIGGFSLGLERAGMETIAFCESDKKAQLVLKKHWPGIPIYDDIRQLKGTMFTAGTIDLICGGFPCQPFSVAGKQKGQEDDRHLWPEMFRLIQEIRPRWVIGENVAGLINMGLDQVLSDLESADYSCQTLVIPACAVNAPHRRDRVWIVGYTDKGERGRLGNWQERFTGSSEDVAHSNSGGPQIRRTESGQILPVRKENPDLLPAIKESGKNVANSTGQRIQRGGAIGEQEPSIHAGQTISRSNGSGVGAGHWSIEPGMGRVANGVSGRVERLKQLGNAVVPQIPEIIGRAIMQIEADT